MLPSHAELWSRSLLCTYKTKLSLLALSRLKALSTPETMDTAGANSASPSQSSATVSNNPPQPATDQKFLKLPVESARKLRFYDRLDLSELIKQHAVDKAVLEAANAALCQVAADFTTSLHSARISSLYASQLGLTGCRLLEALNLFRENNCFRRWSGAEEADLWLVSCVQLLAERGVPEGDVAEEAKRRATEVAALKAADEGVASVLLASAQVVPESFNDLLCVSRQNFVSRNDTPSTRHIGKAGYAGACVNCLCGSVQAEIARLHSAAEAASVAQVRLQAQHQVQMQVHVPVLFWLHPA